MRSLRELVDGDPECDRLLELVDGCRDLDLRIYRALLSADGRRSIDQIAEAVERDRSTTYRAVRRLHEHGYVDRKQVTYENGGYCYEYDPVDPEVVAGQLRTRIEDCHQALEELLEEFLEQYGGQPN